jgi:hypothetical protein
MNIGLLLALLLLLSMYQTTVSKQQGCSWRL